MSITSTDPITTDFYVGLRQSPTFGRWAAELEGFGSRLLTTKSSQAANVARKNLCLNWKIRIIAPQALDLVATFFPVTGRTANECAQTLRSIPNIEDRQSERRALRIAKKTAIEAEKTTAAICSNPTALPSQVAWSTLSAICEHAATRAATFDETLIHSGSSTAIAVAAYADYARNLADVAKKHNPDGRNDAATRAGAIVTEYMSETFVRELWDESMVLLGKLIARE
jgi:hypothetical protein